MFTPNFSSTPLGFYGRRAHTSLSYEEQFWASKQPFLSAHGCLLRPRYRPGWKPSWTQDLELDPDQCEDGQTLQDAKYEEGHIDAICEDGRLVAIKRVASGSQELVTLTHLTRRDLLNDPNNHCVPILKHFKDREDRQLSYLVTPFLRLTNTFDLWCVNDIIEFVDDVMEGLAFMHARGVAHRNISLSTILADEAPLYPNGFHPVNRYRTPDYKYHAWYFLPYLRLSAPSRVRHYFTDFSRSVCQPRTPYITNTQFSPDAALPELTEAMYDPYKADVFCVGNLLRREFRDRYREAAFLTPLVREMIQVDPKARPTAADALKRWRAMRRQIWWIQRLRPLSSGFMGFPERVIWTTVIWPICLFNMLVGLCVRGVVSKLSLR
ncbi:hypothetical protein PsYK624_086970 [Phanerochaete sordida]|uniref:Protein kinase domain-containing protein n=1 Tax=Phanerochaete sordida TaxID=48140 RepID=A0A9P3GB57_9APHY|nr:hypothetical protein PsYK624_086970 [Phanerochaete sordida]